MAQKFIGLDDAALQLGVSKDRLNELREGGQLRAYRDGASWKFRADEIDKLTETGIRPVADSDLDLGNTAGDSGTVRSAADDDFQLGDSAAAASGLDELELDEPTTPADPDEDAEESILLSESEIGDLPDRPPSTIIGKAELDLGSDLDLAMGSDLEPQGPKSDVKLATSPGSDVLSSGIDVEAVLSGEAGNFDDIEELEIDLEAESSRILGEDDTAAARAAAKDLAVDTGSELGLITDSTPGLAPSDSMAAATPASDIDLGSPLDAGSDPNLTGISHLDLGADESAGGVGLSGLSSLELDDDDEVLGEGSDITLSTGDSGINIVSPSDSGLALDDVALDLSGSAIGSSLDLGTAEDDISLEPLESLTDDAAEGEDFLLTPISEGESEDQDSSSQVIALDEVTEDEGADALLGSEAGLMGDDFGMGGGMASVGAMAPVVATSEGSFTTWNIVGLAMCTLMLSICGMMMVDLLQNIWSWNQPYSLNSTIIDGILGLFG